MYIASQPGSVRHVTLDSPRCYNFISTASIASGCSVNISIQNLYTPAACGRLVHLQEYQIHVPRLGLGLMMMTRTALNCCYSALHRIFTCKPSFASICSQSPLLLAKLVRKGASGWPAGGAGSTASLQGGRRFGPARGREIAHDGVRTGAF